MYTFIIALIVLVIGYLIYGRYIARLVDIDPQCPTPAITKADGIDFVPMPTWKVFMIQFLNIAGLGPIFGAIMGALFGTVSYLWIVFGTIFGGAVHDFISGIMSFILEAPMGAYIPGKGLTPWIAQTIAAVGTIAITTWFYLWKNGKVEGAVKIGQK